MDLSGAKAQIGYYQARIAELEARVRELEGHLGGAPPGVSPSPPPFVSKMCRAGEFPFAANQAALHLRCEAKTCSCSCHAARKERDDG